MECSNIKNRLSAYLEGEVSADEKTLIEEHLNSCAGCSADLADLKKTIEYVKEIEEVEPPVWMAQKIMARIRDEGQRKKGIFQRLFYPLHVKLPLEAVAALLVIGVALYVYRDISPEIRLAKAPTEESAPQTLQREVVKEDKIGPFRKSEEKNIPQEVTIAPEKPVAEPVPDKSQPKDRIESAPKAPEPSKQSELRYEERKAPAPAVAGAARPEAGALMEEAKKELFQEAPKMKASSEVRIEATVLTVKVRDFEGANREIEKIVTALGGKVIDRQFLEGKKIFVAEIYSNRFSDLLDKLKSVGEVKEEKMIKGREGAIRVKIEVVEKP